MYLIFARVLNLVVSSPRRRSPDRRSRRYSPYRRDRRYGVFLISFANLTFDISLAAIDVALEEADPDRVLDRALDLLESNLSA